MRDSKKDGDPWITDSSGVKEVLGSGLKGVSWKDTSGGWRGNT